MGRPVKDEMLPRGPCVRVSPFQYLYDKLKEEAEARRKPIPSIALEWLEATYDRRYGEEEELKNGTSSPTEH